MLVAAFLLAFLVPPSRAATSECLDCHGGHGLSMVDSTGARVSLDVDRGVLSNSVHGDLECTDCHAGATQLPHPRSLPPVDCGSCHSDEAASYREHGFRKEVPGHLFPACSDCHGTHDILAPSDPRSKANPLNLPATCGHCHENQAIVGPSHIPMVAPVEQYERGVHARLRPDGKGPVAGCLDCHSPAGTAHVILAPIEPQSTINHFNVAKTCGRCHAKTEADYQQGTHGRAAARGESDAPVCIDCHGAHDILPVTDPRSPVSPTRVSMTVCAPCHASERLNVRYGLPTGILDSWRHSYHGLKSTDGDSRVANCSSCHRAHLVLPASDPASSIAPANVRATCAGCHRGISSRLARIKIHRAGGIFLDATGKAVRGIYVVAIVVIIGLMVAHWLVDLSKRIRVLNRGPQVRRMRRDELVQHTLLMVTFTVLAITGFAFHYSGSWWARALFGWPGGFLFRRIVHLVAATLFILTAVWHVVYLVRPRGRAFLRDIWPRALDFRQFFHTMGYDLGLRREAPRFGRFSYIEKAEYWALVWGTVVMIVTGLALWFGAATERMLQVGGLGVMLVVHFYEAILAGLAIFVWHFYSTIFNPPVYPNNPSWYTGRMPLRMYREEHPDDPALREAEEAIEREARVEAGPETPAPEADEEPLLGHAPRGDEGAASPEGEAGNEADGTDAPEEPPREPP